MSTSRTRSTRVRTDAGWVWDVPKGPNGRGLCRQCGEEVPKGRRTFCGDKCIHEWRITSDQGYAREQVFKRDRGVCSICGWDTEAARRALLYEWDDKERFKKAMYWTTHYAGLTIKEAMAILGIPEHRTESWWDMDHIVAVVEGGGACGLDNLRTLCIPCHQAETAALRARLAEKRRAEKQVVVVVENKIEQPSLF